LEFELALRFLRRRTGVLLRGTSLAAFAGVALAVTALVITLALMNGYSRAIATALQRGNAHM
jgi:ABC-type lipoprotein release transport system permease subunit